MKNVCIERSDIKLTLNIKSQNCVIEHCGKVYKSSGRGSYINFYKKIGESFLTIPKKFSSAKQIDYKINIENDYSAIISKFKGFSVLGTKYDITFTTEHIIYNDGRLDFTISSDDNATDYLHSVLWPRAINCKQKSKNPYSMNCYRQGCLIEDKKTEFYKRIAMTSFPRNVNTGDCYVPLYGRVFDSNGYCSYIDNANDSAIFSSFGGGGSVVSAPMYLSELGKLGYKRVLHTKFYTKCDYNDFAKEYRAFLIANGKLVTLNEKIARNESVKKLIGTPVIHTNIFTKIQPESSYYKKGKDETLHATFEERAEHFKKFKELGLDKAYIHLDGWGNMGYDNLHPYILPPCPQAGGAEGMKKLADTCKEIGYYFGLHDQYRDYYTRSSVYDKNEAVQRIDGSSYVCKIWYGGAHNWLCAKLAPKYVERTYNELEQLGIDIEGTYLDVFSIVLGDECFNKDHRITRTESIAYRGKCFEIVRNRGLIVCSEEPGCLMVNDIDLVHHAPCNVIPQDGGAPFGIPVPIFNLIYHDCVFVPWCTDGIGGWGIPEGEAGEVHCALNAQTPYFNGFVGSHMETLGEIADGETLKEKIEKTKRLCEIQSRLYNKEMLKHEFLSDDKKIQKCTYSDGTEIIADFKNNTYSVNYPKN